MNPFTSRCIAANRYLDSRYRVRNRAIKNERERRSEIERRCRTNVATMVSTLQPHLMRVDEFAFVDGGNRRRFASQETRTYYQTGTSVEALKYTRLFSRVNARVRTKYSENFSIAGRGETKADGTAPTLKLPRLALPESTTGEIAR